ncbi:4337_t:CDS:2 [Funneliformis mosseae]|uniref:4337_t:CDS:1 n=1 Tax=Funneliformis mosseae TaxID=27381 RepID=A0A9N9HL82_FUNMO|nr:4337_t:CDS:2 [Funneliformis mosseae]
MQLLDATRATDPDKVPNIYHFPAIISDCDLYQDGDEGTLEFNFQKKLLSAIGISDRNISNS